MPLFVIVLENKSQRHTKDRTHYTRHYCFRSNLFQTILWKLKLEKPQQKAGEMHIYNKIKKCF